MWKIKKIKSPKVILTSIVVFFTVILFLSLPVLFNYNSIQNLIEKKFYSEFKIKLKITDNISFKFFPRPHYLIKNANLDLNIKNDKSSIVKTKNLKIFIPTKKIYSKSNIVIKKIEIEKTNFFFKTDDVLDFRNHLYYMINKPINIRDSKFFLLDEKNKTILISIIRKAKYFVNKKNNSKELKIKGNIFDSNYSSYWKRSYDKPKSTSNEIRIKKPNLFIENLFSFKDNLNFKGESSISFLNENMVINYLMKNDMIYISSNKENKNQNIELKSKIELNPFFMNTTLNINNKDANFLIDNILSIIFNSKKAYLGNMNGNVTLLFDNIKNSLINKGTINLSIKESEIKLKNSLFEIKNVGKLKSSFKYYEDKGDLIFISKNIFEITNKKEFARKFQLYSKKLKNINKIYFDLEKNIDNDEISISNIYLNKVDTEKFLEEYYIIKNIQVFKVLIRKLLS